MSHLMLPELWINEICPRLKDPWDVRTLSLVNKELQTLLRPQMRTTPGEDFVAYGSPSGFERWMMVFRRNTGPKEGICVAWARSAVLHWNMDLLSEWQRFSEVRAMMAGAFVMHSDVRHDDDDFETKLSFVKKICWTPEREFIEALWKKDPGSETEVKQRAALAERGYFAQAFTHVAYTVPLVEKLVPYGVLGETPAEVFFNLFGYRVDVPYNVLDWAWSNIPPEQREEFLTVRTFRCYGMSPHYLKWREMRLHAGPQDDDMKRAVEFCRVDTAAWLVARGISLTRALWPIALQWEKEAMLDFLRANRCPWDRTIFPYQKHDDPGYSTLNNRTLAFLADMLCPPDKRAIVDKLLATDPHVDSKRIKYLRLLEIAEARYMLAWDHNMGLED